MGVQTVPPPSVADAVAERQENAQVPETRGLMSAADVEPERGQDASASRILAAMQSREQASGFSFAALWGDGEREAACEVEEAIAGRDTGKAALACDVLVTRILASTAGLAGHVDAPRDPGVVALLLGLDGRRYLTFRAIVRAARVGETVTHEDAVDVYAFAIEARRARVAIGR